MQIKKVNLPDENVKHLGLHDINMLRLGQVILLAGKNGSGKTRILRAILDAYNSYPDNAKKAELERNSIELHRNIKAAKEEIVERQSGVVHIITPEHKQQIERNIEQHNRNIDGWEKAIEENDRLLNVRNNLTITPDKLDSSIVYFVPKNLTLTDSYELSPGNRKRNAEFINNNDLNYLAQGVIPAIAQILLQWVNLNSKPDKGPAVSEEKCKEINNNYERLVEYIRIFLGAELQRDENMEPMLFGKRIGEAGLSDGQIILLQFCLALYAREANLNELIIFMDEPENHLHPEVLLYVLDKIVSVVPNGQVWIATHSLNILAHFDPSSIHYVAHGTVKYAGNVPDTVLKGLMGDEDEIIKLHQFLSLPMAYTMEKYAYECLAFPDVKLTDADDKQSMQAREIITQMQQGKLKRKVLDIGIGKARFLSSLHAHDLSMEIDTKDWLDYVGVDIVDTHKPFWEPIFSSVYGSAEKRFHVDLEQVLANHGQSFDISIMCNVLHEIEPIQWVDLFNGTHSISSVLKPEGFLLIMEDQFIPIGELANKLGFILFGPEQFKILFGVTESDTRFKCESHENNGRIMAYQIPQYLLARVTKETIIAALESLKKTSFENVKQLRAKSKPGYTDGRHHALYTQLFTNASLALEEIRL
jgi:predicted ATP-dependent endonuclease of OLD family